MGLRRRTPEGDLRAMHAYQAKQARKRAKRVKAGVSIEAECRNCGDWIEVPADEDPEDTLCVPCAEDEQGTT